MILITVGGMSITFALLRGRDFAGQMGGFCGTDGNIVKGFVRGIEQSRTLRGFMH
jgi:hypothetical protein